MKQDFRHLLKPEIINSISGLALISRVVVDGYLSGLNHSRRVGPGMEFSQYRGYEVGDDMRLLDWKLLARSGRYYIKQSEVETHISVNFILDASHSMNHEEAGISKMDYVRVLTASLAWLAQSQGDAVGLFALNHKDFSLLQPKVEKKHFNRLLQKLISINPQGNWPIKSKAIENIHNRSHKELIFFITDLHEENSELTNVITDLKTSRNEIVVLQVMGENEMDFNYKGSLTFEDLESGAKIEVDAEKARRQYLEYLQESIHRTKEALFAKSISHKVLRLDEPIGEALQLFLKTRQKLM